MLHTKVVEQIKTHFMFNNSSPPPPRKTRRVWDNVEKYGGAWQATENNMAHPLRMLDN